MAESANAPTSIYVYPAAPAAALDIMEFFRTLRRGWLLPALGCLAGLVAAALYVAVTPAPYKSTARILIDASSTRYLKDNKVIDEPIFDTKESESQVYVISSESIIIPVVRSMKLTSDTEFVGSTANAQNSLFSTIKLGLGLGPGRSIDPDVALERTAVEAFLKRLTVTAEDTPSVIDLTFESADPKKAADIANAIAETYIASSRDAKLESTKIASKLVQDRLLELKQQTNEADRALQAYKIANNLVSTGAGTGSGSLSAEQIGSLRDQVATSKITVAEAKSRLERITKSTRDGKPSAAVPDNELILGLRAQSRDLSTKANDIESRVGPKHEAVLKLRKRIKEVDRAISEEQSRIAGTFAGEVQVASVRQDELTAIMNQLMQEAGTDSQAQVKMRELESSADSLRNLYTIFLQKFNELSKAEQQSAPFQDARIITKAAPSLDKNYKKPAVILAVISVLGLVLGAALALAREWFADVFRSVDQVKKAANIYAVVMPTVQPKRTGWLALRGQARSRAVDEYVLDAPQSRGTETIRNVRSLINTAHRSDGAKVFCIVSSVNKEGKTTLASNLAALTVGSSQTRTLIIDGDLHNRHLSQHLAPDAREGLLEVLANPARLTELIHKRPRTGVDILPCLVSGPAPDSSQILGSAHMEQLLTAARQSYDYIIIEVQPVMSGVDVKMIERLVDKFIFVVEWGKTKRSLFKEALAEVEMIRDRLLCVVLNKVEQGALRS
jgi:polysaccharide biosynthesis transport protein